MAKLKTARSNAWVLLALAASVALNVGLIAHVERVLRKPGGVADAPPAAPQPPKVEPTGVVSARSEPAPFSWSQIEADDYPTYIANLRKIGCPLQTIQDIVTADIAATYETRRRELIHSSETVQANAAAVSNQAFASETQAKIVALDAERDALVGQLFPERGGSATGAGLSSQPVQSFNQASGGRAAVNPSSWGANGAGAAGVPSMAMAGHANANGGGSVGWSAGVSGNAGSSSSNYSSSSSNQSATAAAADPQAASSFPSAQATQPMRHELFTLEEQQYRAKWGWQAFYYEADQAQQPTGK